MNLCAYDGCGNKSKSRGLCPGHYAKLPDVIEAKREHRRRWKEKNPDKVRADWRRQHERHRERERIQALAYRNANLEKCREKALAWARENRAAINASRRLRMRNNPNLRLIARLRDASRRALKMSGLKKKPNKTLALLGCGLDDFRSHLERQFSSGMSWDNYGKWEIDHIVPLSAFNLSAEGEMNKACHYTNMQPLWKSDNRRKSDKVVR